MQRDLSVAILPTGTEVRCTFPDARPGAAERGQPEPWVRFGDDAPIPLAGYFLCPQPQVVRGVEAVAGIVDVDGGRACVVYRDGRVLAYGVTHGPHSVHVDADGAASWVFAGGSHMDAHGVTRSFGKGEVVVYSDARTPTPSRETMHPLTRDPNARVSWDGIVGIPLGVSGGWELIEEAVTPDGVTRILARFDGGTARVAFTGYTPSIAQVQAFGDRCVVAVPLAADMATFFVPSEAFTDYAPLDLPVLPFPASPHGCAFVVDGKPGAPWFADTDPRWRDGRLGVLYDLKGTDLAGHAALARSDGRVLYVYADTGRPTLAMFDVAVPDGTAWMPMVQLYPEAGESDARFASRAAWVVGMMAGRFPAFAVFACGFLGTGTSGERTLGQVERGMRAVAALAAATPNVRLVALFTWDRGGVDGVGAHARLGRLADAWAVSSPGAIPTATEALPAGPTPVGGDEEAVGGVTPVGPATPPPGGVQGVLGAEQRLRRDGRLVSPDGRAVAVLQADGNGVVSVNGLPVWATGTAGSDGADWVMQADGNLVLYGASGPALWASGTMTAGSVTRLTDAGALEVVAPSGEVLWTNGTGATPVALEPLPLPAIPATLAEFLSRATERARLARIEAGLE